MANPSITNATAIGKEVIRRYWVDGINGEVIILQGLANHILTVVSIIICENTGSVTNANFSLRIYPDAGTAIILTNSTLLPLNETYIWNDKIALTETDVLKLSAGGSGSQSMDVWVTYIDQQFAAP